ncbi:MAG TPA: permease prefix domain 1-containing protein [Clostridiales bacterium]|nr:permease prefix domain 1-containing protein [Clostridiales bacterium]
MINKIRAYIDHAFEGIPQTKKVLELKEELVGNLIEKYNDYLKNGKAEDEAYTAAISGIGDISELVESMRDVDPFAQPSTKERSRHALFISIAVAIYIISVFMVPIYTINFGKPVTGIFIMFLFIAIATGLIIYSNMTYKNYIKMDDSLVEDFKAYRASSNKQRAAFNSFKSAFWSITVAVYFLISFIYGIWGYSWVIFIIAGAIEKIVAGIIQLRGEE